ncbi:hypothetical protein ACJX0J_031138, partial [Zea mays]
SLARTMVDKSHFLLDQREALEHSAGDHLTTKSEATKAHARVASFQDAHNTLVDASAIQGKFDAAEGSFVEAQSRLVQLEKERHLLSKMGYCQVFAIATSHFEDGIELEALSEGYCDALNDSDLI